MTVPARTLLLIVCAASALGIAAILAISDSQWSAPQAQRPDLAPMPGMEDAPPEVAAMSLDLIAQRPLFTQGRRPYVAPVAVQAGAEPEPEPVSEPFPDAELLGVFGSGRAAGVLLRHGPTTARVAVDAEWSGWSLQSVDTQSSSAVFVSRGEEHVLMLKRQPQQGALVFVPPVPAPVVSPDEAAAQVSDSAVTEPDEAAVAAATDNATPQAAATPRQSSRGRASTRENAPRENAVRSRRLPETTRPTTK